MAAAPPTQPDALTWSTTTLFRSPRTPWQARQAIRLWLSENCPSRLADALLVVSELVTNVLVHVPGGIHRNWVKVRIGIGDDYIRIAVIDPGTNGKEPVFAELDPDSMEESGRGLALVASVSIRYGTRITDLGHRVVWADLKNSPDTE